MNKPLLTIAIPLYNGAQYLEKTLTSITHQFEKNNSLIRKIEILIRDDQSTDGSFEMCKQLLKNYKNVNLYQNNKNIGYDLNIDKIIEEANGQFCWTLNQEVILESNSLSFLISILENNQEVAYVCIKNKKNISSQKDAEYCKNGNEFLLKNLGWGLLSQNIFNKNFLPNDRKKYYGNFWLYYSLALEIIVDKPSILIKNIFYSTENPSRWLKTGNGLFTYINLKKVIAKLQFQGYSPIIIKKVQNKIAFGLPKTIASAKLHDLPINIKIVKILANEFYTYPIILLISYCILLSPKRILELIIKIK